MAENFFSEETPDFSLERHEVIEHDEVDVYGLDHTLVYVSGNVEDVSSYRAGIVTFRVGGALNNPDPDHFNVNFTANIHFPYLFRDARLEGSLVSSVEPQHDELEILAAGFMKTLAQMPIKELVETEARP